MTINPNKRCFLWNPKGNHSGFSFIELAIVLCFVGVLIAGVWVGMTTIINNAKKNQLYREVVQTIMNVKKAYPTSSPASISIDVPSAIQLGLFPKEMIVNNAVVDPFYQTPGDGFSNLNIGPGGVPHSVVLVIGNHGIPYDACVDLASKITTTYNFKNLGVVGVNIGGGTGNAGNGGSGNGTGAVNAGFTSQPTMAAISAACVADNLGSYSGGTYVNITFNVP